MNLIAVSRDSDELMWLETFCQGVKGVIYQGSFSDPMKAAVPMTH